MSLLEDETILRQVCSLLRNKNLEKLYQAGLWDVMRRFANDEYFFHLRTQSLTNIPMDFKPRDWKKVYMNMRSLDLGDVENVNLYGHLLDSRVGHVDTLEVLLELGWRVVVDESCFTHDCYVYPCCKAGNVKALELLDSRCGKMSQEIANESLAILIKDNKIDMLLHILNKYPDLVRNLELCCMAIWHNRLEILSLFIVNLVDQVTSSCIMACIKKDGLEVIKLLLQHGIAFNWQDAIEQAVRSKRVEMLKLLIHAFEMATLPAEVNVINGAFVIACTRGHLEVAQLLSSMPRLRPGYKRNRALRGAATSGRLELVAWLLTLKDVNPLDGKNCAVRVAMRQDREEMCRMLLEHPSVWSGNLDLDIMKIGIVNLGQEARSSITNVARDVEKCLGLVLSAIEVFSWIASPTNSYQSLLQFIIIKCPDDVQLLEMLSESEDREIENAIKTLLYRCAADHSTSTLTSYRGLLLTIEQGLSLESVIASLREEGASDEGIYHTLVLVSARLR